MTSAYDPHGRLSFDGATHRYTLDGQRELISVTTAIKEGLSGACGEEWWTEESRQRGSYVHEAILYHAEGDLDDSTLHPVVAPYFQQYLKFYDTMKPKMLAVERRIFDDKIGYAGTFDLLCELGGPHQVIDSPVPVIDLIDAKTGFVPWWVRMQLAGYWRCIAAVHPNVVIRRWVLNLTRTDYALIKVATPASADAADFLAIVRAAKLKREQV